MRYADSDGDLAVRIARAAIEARLLGRRMSPFEVPAHFEEKSGAFVTINTHPAGELRGCIGHPRLHLPGGGLHRSATAWAHRAPEDGGGACGSLAVAFGIAGVSNR